MIVDQAIDWSTRRELRAVKDRITTEAVVAVLYPVLVEHKWFYHHVKLRKICGRARQSI